MKRVYLSFLFTLLYVFVTACAPTQTQTADTQATEEISVLTDSSEPQALPTQTSEVSKTSEVSPVTEPSLTDITEAAATSTITVTSPAISGYKIQFTIPITYVKQVCELFPVNGQPNAVSIDTAVCAPVSVAINDVLNFTIVNGGSSVPLANIATPSFLDTFKLTYPEKTAASADGGGYFNPADIAGPQVGYFKFSNITVVVSFIATEARTVITNPSSGNNGGDGGSDGGGGTEVPCENTPDGCGGPD